MSWPMHRVGRYPIFTTGYRLQLLKAQCSFVLQATAPSCLGQAGTIVRECSQETRKRTVIYFEITIPYRHAATTVGRYLKERKSGAHSTSRIQDGEALIRYRHGYVDVGEEEFLSCSIDSRDHVRIKNLRKFISHCDTHWRGSRLKYNTNILPIHRRNIVPTWTQKGWEISVSWYLVCESGNRLRE